ncbi:hypothetical protein [Synechococcus phage BUCT-ZZ01]|nr:hypothetical protein [Synechococcus phage BUCT-ZZ01]
MEKKNVLYMMIGYPGSGKDTFVKEFLSRAPNAFLYSTDAYIESIATQLNKTYNDVFNDTIGEASTSCNIALNRYLAQKLSEKIVIWNQTNLTVSSRKKKLANFPPKNWKRVAIVFDLDREVLNQRNIAREEFGRSIPKKVIDSMVLESPTEDEFDLIFNLC